METERIAVRGADRGRGDGRRELAPRAVERARDDAAPLGAVARDAMDHATMIVRDAVTIGRIKATKTVEQLSREVAPKVALGAVAVILGAIGAIFALIAIFLGLGALIPSVAWRLVIFAVVFIGVAIVSAVLATRTRGEEARELGAPRGGEEAARPGEAPELVAGPGEARPYEPGRRPLATSYERPTSRRPARGDGQMSR